MRAPKTTFYEQGLQRWSQTSEIQSPHGGVAPSKEEANKGFQQVRLMEYLNEMPVIQLVADFTEADDIIALVINHPRYADWKKTIISSDKDFFQLCREDVQIYRPIQKKIVTKKVSSKTLRSTLITLHWLEQLKGTSLII